MEKKEIIGLSSTRNYVLDIQAEKRFKRVKKVSSKWYSKDDRKIWLQSYFLFSFPKL